MIQLIITIATCVIWLLAFAIMAYTSTHSDEWKKATDKKDTLALMKRDGPNGEHRPYDPDHTGQK